MKIPTFPVGLLLFVILNSCLTENAPLLQKASPNIPVFLSGEDGYACFRIPAIVALDDGKLIAFAEGRKKGCSDTGDIDLVMKSSLDEGETWSDLTVIWDDTTNTCGNPAPIVDRETGVIHLLSTWNLGIDKEAQIIDQTSVDTRHIYVITSGDQGKSWASPREITENVKLPNWTWYATGPGSGIQLLGDAYKGRLVVGCDHIEAETKKYFSHLIYSDDHGASWKLGGTTPRDQVNECEVAELSNGNLMLNMRNYDRRSKRQRQTAISRDGGLTWEQQQHHEVLIEPRCQASFQNALIGKDYALLFSNPASEDKRVNMTLRLSVDQGQTWPHQLVLHNGPAAYSDIAILPNEDIGVFFEMGNESPYEKIVWAKVNLN